MRDTSTVTDTPYEAHLHGGPWDGEIVGILMPTPRLIGPANGLDQPDHLYTRKTTLGGSDSVRVHHYHYAGRKLDL